MAATTGYSHNLDLAAEERCSAAASRVVNHIHGGDTEPTTAAQNLSLNHNPTTALDLTDQCGAMAKAIKISMPNTRHRWCRWHVLKHAKSHLGTTHSKNSKFKKEFNSLITFETDMNVFETDWKALLKTYKLTKNEYLKRLFKYRERWAKPYFMGVHCGGMTSTQRSESANHMLKAIMQKAAPMHLFVSKFNELQKDRGTDEGREQFVTNQDFAEGFLEDKLTPFYKSDPVPESNDGDVKIVVGKNLDWIVLDESKDVLLEMQIYAPWCGHCQSLEPTYNKLGKHLRGIDSLVIAKMDGTANEHPRAKPDGYPTILFYPAGKKSFEPDSLRAQNSVIISIVT